MKTENTIENNDKAERFIQEEETHFFEAELDDLKMKVKKDSKSSIFIQSQHGTAKREKYWPCVTQSREH